MKLVIVAVRDTALDAFMRPFFVPRAAMAVRSFMDEVNRKDSEMAAHKGDYVLFEVGSFDEESGVFECITPPRQLVRAVDCGQPGE